MKKLLLTVCSTIILVIAANDMEVYANSGGFDTLQTATGYSMVEEDEDVIEYIFRDNNGKVQYRRWNRTRNCWVDPAWIDV